jgi:hypothetical protein
VSKTELLWLSAIRLDEYHNHLYADHKGDELAKEIKTKLFKKINKKLKNE